LYNDVSITIRKKLNFILFKSGQTFINVAMGYNCQYQSPCYVEA